MRAKQHESRAQQAEARTALLDAQLEEARHLTDDLGDRAIRGKVVDHADVQRVTWIQDERRPGNRPFKRGAFDDVSISGRRVQDTIAGNLGVKTGVQLSIGRDAHLRLRETVGTRSRAAGAAAAAAQRAEDSNS